MTPPLANNHAARQQSDANVGVAAASSPADATALTSRSALPAGVALTVLGILGMVLATFPRYDGAVPYVVLHATLEIVSVCGAAAIAGLTWSMSSQEAGRGYAVLGALFLGTAVCDTLHLLSYPGMPPMISPASIEKAIAFWLVARVLSFSGLALVAWVPTPRLGRLPASLAYGVALSVSAAVAFVVLFHPETLPHTFLSGEGLTPFKVGFEYALIALALLATWGLIRRLSVEPSLGRASLGWLAVGTWNLALSEMFFTLYTSPSDLANLLGHLYKDVGDIIVYAALFERAVRWPHARLLAARRDLRIAAAAFEAQGAVLIADAEGRVLRSNAGFTALTGLSGVVDADGEPLSLDALLCPQRHDIAFRTRLWQLLRANRAWEGDIWLCRHGQSPVLTRLTISVVDAEESGASAASPRTASPAQQRLVLGLVDVSEQRAAEAQIHKLAFYDPLTTLANRRLLQDRLQQALARYRRSAEHSALIFLDLDNFKALNDSQGHQVGDQLLVEVGRRLRARVRESDTVARLGGDEFVVLLTGLDFVLERAIAQASAVAEDLRQLLNEPYVLNIAPTTRSKPLVGKRRKSGAELATDIYATVVTPSMGLLLLDDGTLTVDEALRRADVAMYRAKAAGRNQVRRFDQPVSKLRETVTALRRPALGDPASTAADGGGAAARRPSSPLLHE